MLHIPLKIHGLLDYLTGIILLASPLMAPTSDSLMNGISAAFGTVILMYSTITDYPLALLRFVPFPVHRALDLLAGAGLAFAPIHFAVRGFSAILFVALGITLLLLAFLTRGRFNRAGQDQPIVPGA